MCGVVCLKLTAGDEPMGSQSQSQSQSQSSASKRRAVAAKRLAEAVKRHGVIKSVDCIMITPLSRFEGTERSLFGRHM